MKVLTVFGTRPEAIKMAPLVHALAKDPFFEAKVCVTAQHREMLDQVLKLFSIVPDYDLNIMQPGQGLTEITCRILEGLKPILAEFKPDVVLVHGDTTTTLATSLAAFYQRIPVGHVEAGLRTGDLYSPWPEEANRTLTGHLAMYHFSPTETSRQNLLRENVADSRIFITGNTVIDALLWVRDQVMSSDTLRSELAANYPFIDPDKKVDYQTAYDRSLESLNELKCVAEELQIQIGLENVWNKFLLSPMEMKDFIDKIGSEYVGSYLDVGNTVYCGYPEDWVRILGKRIRKVHFKDYRRQAGGLHGFVDLLAGDVNYPEVMKAFREIGYDGWVSAEMIPAYKYHTETLIYNTSRAMDAILGR